MAKKPRLNFTADDHPDFFFLCRVSGPSLSIISWHGTNMFPDIMVNSHLQHFIIGKDKKCCMLNLLISIGIMIWFLLELMFPSNASFLLGRWAVNAAEGISDKITESLALYEPNENC